MRQQGAEITIAWKPFYVPLSMASFLAAQLRDLGGS
jgi:hypothetical protein